jgi:hypothetical protein
MVNTIQMPAYRNGMLVIKEHHTPECGDTTEIDRDTAIIRIDLEEFVNYGHFYSISTMSCIGVSN